MVILKVLVLVGALGFFLFGMKLMSESLQKVAGHKMRSILSAMTSNRFKGIFTGFLVTTMIQSSSATSVMLVSFVNAGLIPLIQAVGVVMGINIGTTVTAWLISILGFKVSLSALSLPLIGLALPLFFSASDKRKTWGEFVVGFAILFLGLQALKEAVPDIKSNPELLVFLSNYTDFGYLSVIIFVLVGTILTIVIQSSSATMALTLVLCYNGLIPFHIAAAMVLGENIGTTITANLAAIVGNSNAKRTARAHFIFNIIGVIWMLIFFFPFIKGISLLLEYYSGVSILENLSNNNFEQVKELLPISLALFHTAFNIINSILLIAFVPKIADMTKYLVSKKAEDDDDDIHLQTIKSGFVSTSEMSIFQAEKEIQLFAKQIEKMLANVYNLIDKHDRKLTLKAIKKMKKQEDLADSNMETLSLNLAKISQGHISDQSAKEMKAFFRINNELESIGDSCYKIASRIERNMGNKLFFKKDLRNHLKQMYQLLLKAYDLMQQGLEQNTNKDLFDKAFELELQINTKRDELLLELMLQINEKEVNFETGLVYKDVISSFEKIGDYIMNIHEAMSDPKIIGLSKYEPVES